MRSTGASRQMQRSDGFAIVVVLLVLVTVFIAMLSSASVSAIGARRSTAGEQSAFSAFLAAESGVNTIGQRLALLKFRMPLNESSALTRAERDANDLDAMNAFISAHGLNSLTLPDGSATLTVLSFEANGRQARATLRSVGVVPGNSSRIVLQDFRLAKPPAFNIAVPGALTSHGTVDVTGNANTAGIDGNSSSGLVTVASLSSAVSTAAVGAGTFTATVDDTRFIPEGGYVRFGGGSAAYRVEEVEGTTLTLTALAGATSTVPSGTTVQIVQNAVREPVGNGLTSTTLALSDNSGMAVGDNVYVRDTLGTANTGTPHVGSFIGVVTAKNSSSRTIGVTWSGSIPSSFNAIAEGVPVRRTVNAVTGASTVSTSGGGTNVGGVSKHDTVRVPAGAELFLQTFGLTEAKFLDQTRVPIQTNWPGGTLSGVNYVRSNVNITGNSSLCGSGILIIDGDLTFNGTCAAGFVGIIYVKGNYDQQGNGFIAGSVIVEGTSKLSGTAAVSSVNPTGSKVFYDSRAVLEQGTLLSPWEIVPIIGTWRER